MTTPSLPVIPVADLHCDLLSYLVRAKTADLHSHDDIGASLPHLEAGHVELQTLAIYTATESGSSKWGDKQVDRFVKLGHEPAFHPIRKTTELVQAMADHKIGIVAAVENASGFCEQDEPLDYGLERLEDWINRVGRLFYISLTHHTENRFGGGNFSDNVGLKEDGQALLDWLDDRQICVDLAHASDQLAHDIFDYIDRYSLNVPVIASHSNFRSVWQHVRNLPDELAREVLHRGGLIGVNLVRAYIDDTEPDRFFDHVRHGWEALGAPTQLAFGADFFATKEFPDPKRMPIFFPDHANASQYPLLLRGLQERGFTEENLRALAHQNVVNFLGNLWNGG
jgi:microsomal dipeptidase-like Zn-dependent dipeptidase